MVNLDTMFYHSPKKYSTNKIGHLFSSGTPIPQKEEGEKNQESSDLGRDKPGNVEYSQWSGNYYNVE